MRRVKVGGWNVAFVERGPIDAPAIVTLHGFIISQRYMAPLAERLAPRFRVLSPDLPGFGRSDKPREVLSIAQLGDALVAWMDAVDLPRAHLVGNSMGCQVALAAAERHPARVDRLVLIGPTTDPHTRTVPQQAALLAYDMLGEKPSLPLAHVPDYLRVTPRRYLKTLEHVMRDRPEERAPRVAAPTLILRGSKDRLVSQRFVEELAARMPDARVEVLPGAPHAANYSAPDATAAATLRFLPQGSSIGG